MNSRWSEISYTKIYRMWKYNTLFVLGFNWGQKSLNSGTVNLDFTIILILRAAAEQ
jgi:hypothetical protein